MNKRILAFLAIASLLFTVGCDSESPSGGGENTKPEGLIAWYKLDQNAADSSGHDHHGVMQSGSFVPDRLGSAQSALSLDGSSFISVANSLDLTFDSSSSYSISGWVKTATNSSEYNGVVAKGSVSGSLPGYALGMKNGFANASISSADNVELTGKTKINDNKWHFLTLTVDSHGGIFLYVDGQVDQKTVSIGMFPDKNNTAPLFLGKDRTSSSFFTGSIDDIRIYGKVLAANDINALFTEGGWSGGSTDTTTGSGTYTSVPLANAGFFTTLTSSQHLDGSSCPPWNVAYGSPWIGAGFGADGVTHGYLYMWGTADDGGAVYENLPTPIQKGHTYRVKCMIRFDLENTTPYVRVRFLAFNEFGTTIPWDLDAGKRASLGSITVSQKTPYTAYVTSEWTADADYPYLEVDVQNDNSGPGAESWARIDDIELQEKK